MKKIILTSLIVVSIFTVACDKMTPKSKSSKSLPSFSLKDPSGKIFTDKDISKEGVVLVLTAPILSNKDEQEGWDKYLGAIKSGKATLVFVEDMGPSAFKSTALKRMEKEYAPGQEPILLIDENGSLRKKLGVAEKNTVVFVYDGDGNEVLVETGDPSAESGKRIADAAVK